MSGKGKVNGPRFAREVVVGTTLTKATIQKTRDFVVADPLDIILTALALSLRCLPRFDQGLTDNPFDEIGDSGRNCTG